jgi:hypothetical protein
VIAQEILTPLAEVTADTQVGSDHRSLLMERFWAIAMLSKIKNKFGTIYILGSWYGNVALMLLLLNRYIQFDRIINDDTNAKSLAAGQARLEKLGLDCEIKPMHQDANRLSYNQIGADGLVINLSCHNIKGSRWFDRIPAGTQVVLQTRNNDPAAVNQFKTFKQFDQTYQLSQTQYQGTLTLQDPDGVYQDYMKIGIK